MYRKGRRGKERDGRRGKWGGGGREKEEYLDKKDDVERKFIYGRRRKWREKENNWRSSVVGLSVSAFCWMSIHHLLVMKPI